MSKRSLFTSITPLPTGVTRGAAVSWLHDHVQMIKLNPLVLRLHETTPPPNAAADEFECAWYEITDEISYLPGGLYKGEVTYKACFNDLPNGIQTHTFAPAGLDLRGKWTVCGNEPGEPRETLELGSDAPREGLYIREDVDMRCNFLLTGFVKKNLTKSHKSVVDRISELGRSETQKPAGDAVTPLHGDLPPQELDATGSGSHQGENLSKQHNDTNALSSGSLGPDNPPEFYVGHTIERIRCKRTRANSCTVRPKTLTHLTCLQLDLATTLELPTKWGSMKHGSMIMH